MKLTPTAIYGKNVAYGTVTDVFEDEAKEPFLLVIEGDEHGLGPATVLVPPSKGGETKTFRSMPKSEDGC